MNEPLSQSEQSNEWVKIGKLGKAHGVKGEIRLYSLSDIENRFDKLTTIWWLGQHGKLERLQVDTIRPAERFFLIRFKSYDTPETVKKLSNGFLVVSKEERGTLPEGRYFIDDIIGIKVFNEQGQVLGHIKEVWQPGPHDVYEIHGQDGEIMVPAIDEYILETNIEEKTMVIKVLDTDDQD